MLSINFRPHNCRKTTYSHLSKGRMIKNKSSSRRRFLFSKRKLLYKRDMQIKYGMISLLRNFSASFIIKEKFNGIVFILQKKKMHLRTSESYDSSYGCESSKTLKICNAKSWLNCATLKPLGRSSLMQRQILRASLLLLDDRQMTWFLIIKKQRRKKGLTQPNTRNHDR